MGIGSSKPVGGPQYDQLDFDHASPARHAKGPDSSDYDSLLNSLQAKDRPGTNWQDFSIKDKNIGDVSRLVDELDKAYPDDGWKSVAITLNGVTTFLKNSEADGRQGIQFIVPREAQAAYEKALPQDLPLGKWIDYDAQRDGLFFQRLLGHFGTDIKSEHHPEIDEQAYSPFSRAAHKASVNAPQIGQAEIHIQPAGKSARASASDFSFPELDYWRLNDGHANVEVELGAVQVQPKEEALPPARSPQPQRQRPVPPPYVQRVRDQAIPVGEVKVPKAEPDPDPLEF
jgi:hypothetical protein